MNQKEKFDRFIQKYPHRHAPVFFERPHLSRRQFFELGGAGVTGFFLPQRLRAADTSTQAAVTPKGTARNCIFILLAGAPSHIDTFDFKQVAGVTPNDFNPTTVNGILFPVGLLPKMAQQLPNIAIARSMRAWALVHNLAQVWTQIGRNPAAALGDIAPNIGSIVAAEKESERRPTDVLPTFLALNSGGASGSGYLSAKYAPFKTNPAGGGLPNSTTTAAGGPAIFNERFGLMHTLDDPLRVRSPLGKRAEDLDAFYTAARSMIDNPVIARAFSYPTGDSERYGNSPFGNACLVAKQVLGENAGTRYIQITLGGWDMHQNIYNQQTGLYRLGKFLDDGLSALLTDLKSSGLLNETLVVVQGEFGRTVGALSAQQGRDHYLVQFGLFAGAGVRGGKVIGSTDSTGGVILQYGWSRDREIRPEDVEATVYSALGIDWTKVRYDDPFGRGFEYVPYSGQDVYGPINELWT